MVVIVGVCVGVGVSVLWVLGACECYGWCGRIVGVTVIVGVSVGVGVTVGVGVMVDVAVCVGVLVSVGVGVRVAVGSAEHQEAVYENPSSTQVRPYPLSQVVWKTYNCKPEKKVDTCPRSVGGGLK